MDSWHRSDVTYACMEGLVKRGLLCGRTNAVEWLVPSYEEAPTLPDGYIVSFVLFHKRGLVVPPHPFFRDLLHHYQIELQHLNPNRIQHIAAFIAMCEGYLGIEPHFEVGRYFFSTAASILHGFVVPLRCYPSTHGGPRQAWCSPCEDRCDEVACAWP